MRADRDGNGEPLRMVFHEGEREVQARVGVQAQADKLGHGIRDVIPDAVQRFLRAQRVVYLGAADARGALWATALSGPPGFLTARDAHTVAIAARPGPDDGLVGALRSGAAVGLLAIELATRRRVRLNGTLVDSEAGLRVRTQEVFANCPRYIQRRELADEAPAAAGGAARAATVLDERQRTWITAADTFFIATAHPTRGADVSHRGGAPGFVQVIDAATLRWPDYAGNGMFQTLGNLALRPDAGLLFLDFARGAALQVSGAAHVLWDAAAATPGAERMVELRLTRVIERAGAVPSGWRLLDASPHNPEPARR